jgi:preprotein translocase subunit SecD
MKHSGRNLIIIFVIFFFSVVIALPKTLPVSIHLGPINFDKTFYRQDINFNINGTQIQKNFDLLLGLDLVGGSRLVFDIDTTKVSSESKKEAISSLKSVIERRVNLFGVSEPSIQTTEFEGKNRVVVELPGVKDTKQAVALVGKTAQLVFAQVIDETKIEPTDLTGADLKSAKVSFDQVSGKAIVQISFSEEGAKKFASLTEKNKGKPLPIVLDNSVISAPVVSDKIVGGNAQISGNFTTDAARDIAIQLNAGALPLPIQLIEERTVGATLGTEAVQKSVMAGAVGLGIVAAFMIILYKKLGLISAFGLIVFSTVTISLYKLIPVVLTLPGITGFLLSVGMAVDSNILVFERFKEEKAKGIETKYALETAFGRAWNSIRDANVATLVTCFVLANPLDWSFLNTSGPVRGFAITLALGIAVSLYTGVFVSRNLLRFFIKK